MSRSALVPTPIGDARVLTSAATDAAVTLVLGHGASGGADAPDLSALASALPAIGVTVIRVEQPWRVAGRRVAAPAATLDRGWLAVLEQLPVADALVVGGRSAGARVACRTATQLKARGVVALAFPLHPPGRPERSRLLELRQPIDAGIPTLVVQGERDAFGRPEEFPTDLSPAVRAVPGADHGLSGRRTAGRSGDEVRQRVVAEVSAWLRESSLLTRC
jgi:predicted alpha/beta-hydrolase family hydrolase